MKRALILVMIITSCFFYAQEEKKTDSKVVSATVFKNRALVTRETQIDLPKGKHKLIFSNLPVDLLDESVRISSGGKNTVKILDVKVEQRFTVETQQKNIKSLENQIDSLNQLVIAASDKIAVYNSKKEFVESLKAQSSKYINEKMLLNLNNTKEWNDMLSYVDNNLNDIYKGIREQNRKKTLCEQKISALRSEINQLQGKKNKNYKEVILNVEVTNKGAAKLYPSYIVQNASWYPVYDARVLSQTKETDLYYFGMLQQSTGEDWNDISLTLSTAEPLSIKTLPQLDRWFIDTKPLPTGPVYGNYNSSNNSGFQITYERNWGLPSGTGTITGHVIDAQTGEALLGANVFIEGTGSGSQTDDNGRFFLPNVPSAQYNLVVNYIGYQQTKVPLRVNERNTASLTIPINPSSVQMNEVTVLGNRAEVQKDMTSSISLRGGRSPEAAYKIVNEEQYTNVSAKELSTTFEIQSNNTIPSDNSYHKVTIAIHRTPIDFKYTSIPKITPGVYLKGKMVNDQEYPLLAGEINVFMDNDFINRTYINTIVPTDTLELALGIDERIQAKKMLVNKFQESKGLLGGKKQITYDYEIQIQNNRQTEENVMIYDQVPIAMNEDITVNLLEPEKQMGEKNKERKLEWNLTLKPGEKKVIPVKYQIVYPNNFSIFGME